MLEMIYYPRHSCDYLIQCTPPPQLIEDDIKKNKNINHKLPIAQLILDSHTPLHSPALPLYLFMKDVVSLLLIEGGSKAAITTSTLSMMKNETWVDSK